MFVFHSFFSSFLLFHSQKCHSLSLFERIFSWRDMEVQGRRSRSSYTLFVWGIGGKHLIQTFNSARRVGTSSIFFFRQRAHVATAQNFFLFFFFHPFQPSLHFYTVVLGRETVSRGTGPKFLIFSSSSSSEVMWTSGSILDAFTFSCQRNRRFVQRKKKRQIYD